MLRVGIAERVAAETTDANFHSAACPTCPARINLFEMNTITQRRGASSPHNEPHEHFRSTGIRDGRSPSVIGFSFGAFRCLPDPIVRMENNICFANLWDCGDRCPPADFPGRDRFPGFSHVTSNDEDVAKRPAGCGKDDSGERSCPSQLHGAIGFMFQEFGTPTGSRAEMALDEYRRLWLEAEYPAHFKDRSPRDCIAEDVTAPHLGCQRCFHLIRETVGTSVEKYCRCVRSRLDDRELGLSEGHAPQRFHEICALPASGRRRLNNAVVLDGLNLTEVLTSWEQQRLASGADCEPFCAATGSFLLGVGMDFLNRLELTLVRPPSLPPNTPMLPPLPPLFPGSFIERYIVTVTLTSSVEVSQVNEDVRESLASFFAHAANVSRAAVTIIVQAGSAIIDAEISTTAETTEAASAAELSILEHVFLNLSQNGTDIIMFGLPLTTFPSTSVSLRRIPLPLPVTQERGSEVELMVPMLCVASLSCVVVLICSRKRRQKPNPQCQARAAPSTQLFPD